MLWWADFCQRERGLKTFFHDISEEFDLDDENWFEDEDEEPVSKLRGCGAETERCVTDLF